MLIIINIMSTAPRKRLFCPRSIKSSISLSCPFASLYSTRYVHLLNQITPPGMCTYSSSNHWGQDVDYGPAKLQRIFSASKVDKKLVFCTLKGVCRNFPLHLYYLYILCPTPPLNERKRRKKRHSPFLAVFDMAIPVEQFDLVHFLPSLEWGNRGLSVVPGKLWFSKVKIILSWGE